MELGLRDRLCVVTGSTGGIGLATAKVLVGEGARVVTCGRGEAPSIGEARHVRADLSRPGEPERLIAEAGALDVLVNNAGYAELRDFLEVTDRQWDEGWQLNVMSYIRAIRAAVPGMRERGGGVIVNVSSTAGKRPSSGMPDYSVTKAAVLSVSRLVADLYAGEGIRCNAVTPGPTATEAWLRRGGAGGGRARRPAGEPQRQEQGGGARIGGERAAPRPARRARRDRSGDRVPLLRAGRLRDRGGVERRRRDRADHHLTLPPGLSAVGKSAPF